MTSTTVSASSTARRSTRIAKRLTCSSTTTASHRRKDVTAGTVGKNKKRRTSSDNESDVQSFPIEDDLLLQNIFSYVGDCQYLFIGSVNRMFQNSYVSLYPQKVTRFNGSTIELTKFCWDVINIIARYYIRLKDVLRSKLWDSVTKYGSIEVVKYVVGRLPTPKKKKKKKRSSKNDLYGDFEHSAWVEDWKYDLCSNAATFGHFELLQWAVDQNIYVSKDDMRVCICAIGNGHMDIFHWAVQNGFDWEEDFYEEAAFAAAKNGQLEALQWIHANCCDLSEDDDYEVSCCNYAAEYGHVKVLRWLHSIGAYCNKNTLEIAIEYGQTEALQFMVKKGCRGGLDTCQHAAIHGNLAALQILRSVHCPWDDFVPAYAAARGHVDVVVWTMNNGCTWSETICQYAAAYGTLDTLKWLRAQGCPWDTLTTKHAHTKEIYGWAVANGCPVAEGNPRSSLFSDLNYYN